MLKAFVYSFIVKKLTVSKEFVVKKKKTLFFVCCCLCLFIFSSISCDKLASTFSSSPKKSEQKNIKPAAKKVDDKDVLVRVDDWVVSIDEFNERLEAVKQVAPEFDIENVEIKKQALDELIKQQLLVQEAIAKGADQDKDIKMAVEEFERSLLVRSMIEKIVANIEVSDSELMAYYEENKEQMLKPKQWDVKEIVAATQIEANDILSQVLKEEITFEAAAVAYSISESAENEGEVGVIQAPFFPALEAALQSLQIGEISSVFEGPGGFYIVKVVNIMEESIWDFDEIKEDLQQVQLQVKQQEAVEATMKQLMDKVNIEKNMGLLE